MITLMSTSSTPSSSVSPSGTTAKDAPNGSVIEYLSNNHGLLVGNTDSLPRRRVVAVVNHVMTNGFVVAYDRDRVRLILPPDAPVTVLAAQAEAGWGNL